MALSRSLLKTIQSLNDKKHRKQLGLFVAEGPKIIREFLPVFRPEYLLVTDTWLQETEPDHSSLPIINVSEKELKQASLLKAPQQVIGVFRSIDCEISGFSPSLFMGLNIVLDNIQDPGNLGTIIRIADWFGVKNIFCSPNTADVYNPKVIQATMGSLARVRVYYHDLLTLLQNAPQSTTICATALDGQDLYESTIPKDALIIMGNEGKGISHQVSETVEKKLLIPAFPPQNHPTDSLNVAVATAVICAEIRRRQIQ